MTRTNRDAALTRRTYHRLVYGIIGVGIVGLLVGLATGRYLVGTVVYLLGTWIGGAIAFLAPKLSDARLQDERDYDLHNRASGLAVAILTVVTLSVVPPLYVLEAGDYVDLGGALGGAIGIVSVFFLLYGVCYGVVTRGN